VNTTVLVVDDEERIRSSIRGILTDEGYRVLDTSDPCSAMQLIAAEHPAVVVLDVWMPGMDGIELLRQIKQASPMTQVIMISGHANIQNAVAATRLGAADFIEKPFSVNGLLAALERVLAGEAGEQPLPKREAEIDATTLRHKVLCGYQGWFRCPDDPAKVGWRHWSRDAKKFGPNSLTFEMWPDMTEYEDDEKYPAPGFTYPDSKPAHLFSSANPKTVDRHFRWMQQYGIDGALLQRFVVDIPGDGNGHEQVLKNVIAAAQATGRTWAIKYDVSNANMTTIAQDIEAVDMQDGRKGHNRCKHQREIEQHPRR